ncbi:3'(2'),5'-bisphosphate nucleotidase CysQ [Carboxylicivirga sp. M1479]|uniref:3'(2'),5'-bisphosphate nucleotidase CysQ family protein n=1 Tax=Carboxylicivirga sp. M1479 TaxID=2594476 RepID=UPI00117863A3|nr:inositol monophosphatase family protein [Carboxylicivirga sp. M1479]TRX70444.1 inositol monophosphatase [Carboxylicivirga sp. M1479]
MQLNPSQLNELATIAIKAASEAGIYIAKQSKKQFAVHKKQSGENLASQVLTEIDLASEKIILQHIKPSLHKYDLALLSEETVDNKSRFEKDYFWCIDPLDGTLPFIEQTDGYSVSIALVDKSGKPHIGVIYNPVDDTLYHAIIKQGAYKNRQKWRLKTSDKKHTLVCDRSLINHALYNQIISLIKNQSSNNYQLISHGGAAMNAMWVLENAPAIYLKPPKASNGGGSLWDYAASACIFKELGAFAQSFNGEELDLNRAESTFMNHKGILYASYQHLANSMREYLITGLAKD